jgi:hypothetical protein
MIWPCLERRATKCNTPQMALILYFNLLTHWLYFKLHSKIIPKHKVLHFYASFFNPFPKSSVRIIWQYWLLQKSWKLKDCQMILTDNFGNGLKKGAENCKTLCFEMIFECNIKYSQWVNRLKYKINAICDVFRFFVLLSRHGQIMTHSKLHLAINCIFLQTSWLQPILPDNPDCYFFGNTLKRTKNKNIS